MGLCRSRKQATSAGGFFCYFSTVPISNRKVASSATPSTEKELCSAAQNQRVQSIHVPCSEHSPGVYQKLYEQVQTQMSLMTGQPLQKNNEIPAVTHCPTSNQG